MTDVAAKPAQTPPAPEKGPRNGILDRLAAHQGIVVPIVAIALALIIGAILIRTQGVNPTYAYTTLFNAAWGSPDGILTTLQKATPLILSGLAVTVALRVGLFNIGAQGQLLWGAVGALIVAVTLSGLPSVMLIPASMIGGAIFGALWAAIAGALKATRGVHEVISTIMLNSIAAGVIDWLVSGPLRAEGQTLPISRNIPESAFLKDLGFLPVGFIVALALAALIAWILKRTTLGFEFDTVGKNKFAALYAGMGIPRTIITAMGVSGALAGLGGAIETLGVVHRYQSGSSAGLGFDGITIALLARANPWATIPAALLVATMRSGSSSLQFNTGIKPEIVDVLLAVMLLLLSLPILGRMLFGRRAKSDMALSTGWGS